MFSRGNRARLLEFAMLTVVVSSLLVGGCVTNKGGPAVLVGNATEKRLESAVINSGAQSYAFGGIQAFKVSQSEPRLSALAETVTVEWRTEDGQQGKRTVVLGKDLREYNGQIQFQVDAEGAVKVFTAPVEGGGASELPWSMPASWEGSPTIPGMNQ